ncbi:MAG: hypothetical protein IT429_18810, partial [Gemmataceae bacterium]|nr:hypothetical protein [Gemmataceae bacterium]
ILQVADGVAAPWADGDDELVTTARRGVRHEREERARRERADLLKALAVAGGNKAEAARALGMARSTLVSRLKKLGLG